MKNWDTLTNKSKTENVKLYKKPKYNVKKDILVAADFNINTNQIAIKESLEYVNGGTVHIVTVRESSESDSREDKMRQDVIDGVQEFVEDVNVNSVADFQYEILDGSVPESISEYAENEGIDFIIMMSSWNNGLILQSVTKSTIEESPCPVLVMKNENH